MSSDIKQNGKTSGRIKPIPLVMAKGPQEYIPGDQELPVQLTSLADMLQWAQNWARSKSVWANALCAARNRQMPDPKDKMDRMVSWRIVEQAAGPCKRRRSALVWLRCPRVQGRRIVSAKNERERYECCPKQRELLEHHGAAPRFEQVAGDWRTKQHACGVKSVVNRGAALVLAGMGNDPLQR